jgi:drug/metabolite transporter (DMT)-like permease
MNRTRLSYIYAGLAVLFWSTIPTAFKIGLREVEVIQMLTIATLTSALVLFIIVLSGKKLAHFKKIKLSELLISALLGFINPFIYYLILLRAYQLLPAQIAQPLNMIWPIIIVFLSRPLLKQKIPGKSFIALIISFVGVCIISSQGHPFHPGRSNLPGVLLATGSSVFWALYFILNVRDKRDESVKLFTNFVFASVYLITALLISGKAFSIISFTGAAASVYVGIFEMGITFFFWLKSLQLTDNSARVSNLVFLAPFLSLVFVHFILKEPVYLTTPIGLLLIVSGIYVQNRKIKIG